MGELSESSTFREEARKETVNEEMTGRNSFFRFTGFTAVLIRNETGILTGTIFGLPSRNS